MLGVMAITCFITVGAFTGCSVKDKDSVTAYANMKEQQISTKDTKGEAAKSDKPNSEESKSEEPKVTEEAKSDDSKVVEEAKTDESKVAENETKIGEFKNYISLLGQKKDDLTTLLKEQPTTIDEGGLDFKNAQLRVWLDKDGLVNQVFTMNKEVDFNGVKIGADIKNFKEVFGDPISDNNGDAHFKYDNVYLSVNYDTKTGGTYAVYILNENF